MHEKFTVIPRHTRLPLQSLTTSSPGGIIGKFHSIGIRYQASTAPTIEAKLLLSDASISVCTEAMSRTILCKSFRMHLLLVQ